MNSIERNIGFLTKEEKQRVVNEIIGYFLSERNETIGVIAAEELLDFLLQNVAVSIHNKAIEHVRKLLEVELEEIDFKVSELRR